MYLRTEHNNSHTSTLFLLSRWLAFQQTHFNVFLLKLPNRLRLHFKQSTMATNHLSHFSFMETILEI